MPEINKTFDEWEEKLEIQLKELKNCQEQKSLFGCEDCDSFFDCQIRKAYVKSVYESMNKGEGGGFEF